MTAALAVVFGYLLGSIPFGLLITRFAGTKDIRSIGSGNIGATNVLRTGRKGLAAATLVLDALKGATAVVVAAYYAGHYAALVAGLGAFTGHLFPLWLRFKGGKGVATYIGLLIGLCWQAAVVFCAIWLVVAVLTRYSSLAGLIASAAMPFSLWLLGLPDVAALFLVLTALIWIKHRANIGRLLSGSEDKIGVKASP